jgi:hypothetical protein
MPSRDRRGFCLTLLIGLLALIVGCGDDAQSGLDAHLGLEADGGAIDAPQLDDAPVSADAPQRLPGTPTAMTYWMGPFTPDGAVEEQQDEEALKTAGYTTIIHGLIHFYPESYGYPLYYGGLPLTRRGDGGVMEANPAALFIRDLNDRLRSGGTIRTIFVSIGGGSSGGDCWQADYDFARINAVTQITPHDDENPFFQGLLVLRDAFGIDGIDLDFEPSESSFCHPDGTLDRIAYDDGYAALLARITKWAAHHGLLVTAAPYKRPEFWRKVLAQTNVPGEGQLMSWLNYQAYGNSEYADWIEALPPDGGLAALGVPDLHRFFALGYSSDKDAPGLPPGPIQQRIACAKSAYPWLNAGFIWQYGNSVGKGPDGGSGAEYAQAILQGLASPAPCDGGP